MFQRCFWNVSEVPFRKGKSPERILHSTTLYNVGTYKEKYFKIRNANVQILVYNISNGNLTIFSSLKFK